MNRNPKRGNKRISWLIILVAVVVAYMGWALFRPLPALQPIPVSRQFSVAYPPSKLNWPLTGQSAVAVAGSSILDFHGAQTPVPIASTAKVITALLVLQQKPLRIGEQGPVVTLKDSDVALYNSYTANEGSVLPVVSGEQITEYQMLQAIMLPSANNIADSLAIWAFGSLAAYSAAANSYTIGHGMPNTRVGSDASGFSPSTTSTAHDLARLGLLAISQPVLAQIVAQASATGIPQANSVKNVNSLLGTDNIIGVKTGNTDQAGGAFISASRVNIGKEPVTIVTALAGAPNLFSALKDSLGLIRSAQTNFSKAKLVEEGQVVANYRQPWGGIRAAVADQSLEIYGWNGTKATASGQFRSLAYPVTAAMPSAGVIRSTSYNSGHPSSIVARIKDPPTKPTLWWRLANPL